MRQVFQVLVCCVIALWLPLWHDMVWHPTPAGALWAGGLAVFLFGDAVLIRKGHESASEWYGRNWKKCALLTGFLLIHLHAQSILGEHDPLHKIAQHIRLSTPGV